MTCNEHSDQIYNTQNNGTYNDVYQENRDEFLHLKECDELAVFLQKVAPLHSKHCHFTTMDKFAKICKSERFRFSSAYSTNDLQEVFEKGDRDQWEHIYSVSFSHGDNNNFGMWRMYGGNCQYEALCLEFSENAVENWKEEILQKKDVRTEEDKKCSSKRISVSFHDIAYIHGRQEKKAENVCWGNIINSDIAKAIADTNHRIMNNEKGISKNTRLTGFVKNSAWEQEKESRIMIKLPSLKQNSFISVPVGSLLDNVKIYFSPFSKLGTQESIALLQHFVRVNGSSLPKEHEKNCCSSYFKYLVQ